MWQVEVSLCYQLQTPGGGGLIMTPLFMPGVVLAGSLAQLNGTEPL